MLSIVDGGQAMDSALAEFVGVPLPVLRSSQDASGDDFAIDLELADMLNRLTCKIVCVAHDDHVRGIERNVLEKCRGV